VTVVVGTSTACGERRDGDEENAGGRGDHAVAMRAQGTCPDEEAANSPLLADHPRVG
jgi:hypothetical protein